MSTLQELLNHHNKKQLTDFAKLHGMRGYSSLKKAELAQKLADYMSRKDVITLTCSFLRKEETDALSSSKEYTKSIKLQRPADLGYCFTSDSHTYLIPKDLPKELFLEQDFINQQKKNSLWLDLLLFVATLYGCAPLSFVCDLYHHYTKEKISLEEASEITRKIPSPFQKVLIIDQLCVQKDLAENDLYKKIQLCQGNISYYIPDYQELSHFLRQGYFNDEYTNKLLEHFLNHRKLSSSIAYSSIAQLQALFRQGGTLAEASQYLSSQGIIADLEMDKTMLSLLNTMFSHSRLLLNRGYTESEKVAMQKPARPASANKIYPNSPCPCGSGKKYKKCCGK